jgi:uncharacterized SAM-binding protein YcdF (DUF218 family)
MELGELKPILVTLALPPLGLLLLAAAGWALAWRRRGAGLALIGLSLALLMALGSHAVALHLARNLLPQYAPLALNELASVQAVVVLGGGVVPVSPEYGQPQLGHASFARLRYGAWLAKRSGKPLGFAGGRGWVNPGGDVPPEGDIAGRIAADEFGLSMTWIDNRSRDTAENAAEMARLMRPAGVQRVALVTDSWHMPRALQAFRRAGLQPLPAPMGFPVAGARPLLEWLPSLGGWGLSYAVLREALALQVARFTADLP